MRCSAVYGAVATLAFALVALPASEANAQVVHPWQRLGASLEGSYGFPNILFHAGAVVATVPMVYWVDEPVQRYLQEHDPLSDELGTVALISGAALPALIPASLYVGGLLGEHDELATVGAAAVQAAVIQLVVVHALKWLTDRAGPYPDGDPTEERWSSGVTSDSNSAKAWDFNPFNLRWGLRWPSGHTSASIAVAASLSAFYPDEPWLPLVGYPAALIIGIGMVEGDYHWLSDVVAGALMGHAIGWTVGGEFRQAYEAKRAQKAKPAAAAHGELRIRATPTVEPLGVAAIGTF